MNQMLQTSIIQKRVDRLWTTQDLCARFEGQPTPMTIFMWRRNRGLPAVIIPGTKRPTIRFVPEDVIRWARTNRVKIKPKSQ